MPVIVGGGDRGVVLSATYPARAYGVRSGMPMTRARRLCPARNRRPARLRRGQRGLLGGDGDLPQRHAGGRDRCRSTRPSSTCRGSLRRFASPTEIGEYLRARICDEQRITCSVGIAATTQLAKLASRRAKPDGLFVVPRDEVTAFLHPLAVEELWGVGEKTAEQLHRLGLRTVGDLAHTPRRPPAAGARDRYREATCMRWPGEATIGGVTPRRGHDEPEHSTGPTRRSAATSTIPS